ncbi:MAG: N-acyl homoserine lactonase family protein [Flavobacteriaceae bacterium]|nr:N-acyl homoserine lactonase family protein [Flavobacteriaceae bacterium]
MNKLFLFFICISIFACKNSKKIEDTVSSDLKAEISLHVLDGGTVIANTLELFSEDTTYTGQSKQLADAFYVIKHPKGNLMWDAGLPESLVGLPEPFTDPSGAFTVSRSDSLVNQLKTIDLTVDDFTYIAMSHSHFDHVGHANALKNATWLVQENEYNFFTNDSAKVQQADIYNSINELTTIKKLNGDHDVFGDGTVIIKSMPGHTIGHQVLYVDLGLEKPILLTGDLYHFEENRANKIAPIFNYDIAMTKKSMEDFEVFAKEKNADVFIQHSQKDFNRLKEMLKN